MILASIWIKPPQSTHTDVLRTFEVLTSPARECRPHPAATRPGPDRR